MDAAAAKVVSAHTSNTAIINIDGATWRTESVASGASYLLNAKLSISVAEKDQYYQKLKSPSLKYAKIPGGSRTPMSDLELVYFNFAGRADYIRLACTIGGVKFTDTRLSYEEFKKRKPTFPNGQVPVLVIDGKEQLTESNSILRFVGKLGGLYPSDPLVAARVDAAMDTIEELWSVISISMYPTRKALEAWTATQKAAIRKRLNDSLIPTVLARLDKALGAQAAALGQGKVAGFVGPAAEPTIADLKMHTFCKWLSKGVLDGISTDIVSKKFKNVQALVDAIDALEPVRSFFAQVAKNDAEKRKAAAGGKNP